MFFFRKKPENVELHLPFLAGIGTDIHSHLLPAVDDGSQDLDTSVEFIETLHSLGIQNIITTPHVMMDRYPNSAETLSEPYQQVKNALAEKNIPVQFHHAAEYYMDEFFEELMKAPLMTLNGEMILVEISFMSAPPQLHQWLFELAAQGYRPVLAHPERYNYFHSTPEEYKVFKQRGCLLQVNLLSLTGYYGRHIQKAAEWLIEHKQVDYIGTDLHHSKHLHAIKSIAKDKKLVKLLESYPFKNNTIQLVPQL
ncbi:tyrosine-protein phosphatase [Chitinophaga sancti]|uniref:protein-tyrosine-phosphatase n=1 Tax=Chitinophaga sancti TaxID=1004 RepID=A0A1K1MSF1_9BACT|nr:CpsB/CapC family capsule biosynthesis tyrosine phosphatase [Chitinophaga sancti]WQD62937.1 CpsB/CapC family capsule biosynthesis tyrosine phosphatase [Chitinophaga sancti]WQG91438.1 CpsB/CapC family capsule biosynthesis tyrosine phosphatase [Chitinophaga sancti]SFW26035.1 Tyrosine-protein phosphatase YwqE [Chitinophaga sancti]